MTQSEREFTEHTYRWLQARRDFPGLNIEPMPTFLIREEDRYCYFDFYISMKVRSECIREFERSISDELLK